MMCKLILVLSVCILKTCATRYDGGCCESIRTLVEKKEGVFKTLCATEDALSLGCCDDIKKEMVSFKDAYNSLCGNISELCNNPKALGIESSKIPNSAFNASSMWDGHYPYYVRPGSGRCWFAKSGKEKNSWIQIDLGKPTTLSGLETLGCRGSGWTKTYSISFSMDGIRWFKYKEYGVTKVFQGNTDGISKVRKTFKVPIKTRYIRWFPITWQSKYPLIQMELYGCPL